jgi:hypothetical protein
MTPPHQHANANDPTISPGKSPTVAQLPLSQQRPNADAPPLTHQHCCQFPVNAPPPTHRQRRLARAELRERSKRCCPHPQLHPGPPITWAKQREHCYPPQPSPWAGSAQRELTHQRLDTNASRAIRAELSEPSESSATDPPPIFALDHERAAQANASAARPQCETGEASAAPPPIFALGRKCAAQADASAV